MMQFTYNNKTYNVANHATIEDRLKLRELFELPLAGWKELFAVVNGKADSESLRKVLIAKINNYDSVDVNVFEYHGEKLWWDKDTRMGLMNLANCATRDILILINNKIVSFTPEDLKNLLAKLEIYANSCYVRTHLHLMLAEVLNTIEDIINYDYTVGYPNKVIA